MHVQRLAAIAATVPPAWIDLLSTSSLDADRDDILVAIHPGPWSGPTLDLQALRDTHIAPHAADGDSPCVVWIQGDVTLSHALVADDDAAPVHLWIDGQLHTPHALLSEGIVAIGGDVQVSQLLWGDGPDGALTVHGTLNATWAVWTRHYQAHHHQPGAITWQFDSRANTPEAGADPTGYLTEALAACIVPDAVDALANGNNGPHALLNRGTLLAHARAGQPLLRDASTTQAVVSPPRPAAQTPIDIASIQALVYGPLLERRVHSLQDWFADIDYALYQRHIDNDGETRDDSVFITIHRRWDFYFAITRQAAPRHLLERLGARLGLVEAPFTEQLQLQYRPYSDEGECGEWTDWDESAPAAALEAGRCAWQAVQAHILECVAQKQAGNPLWQALQQGTPPARIDALTQLPIFTHDYNDWWGERNGFWVGDVWVGARQAHQHDGKSYPRALRLNWQACPDAPGDEPYNSHASYLLSLERSPQGTPWLDITEAQRQRCGRSRLHHHSAAHLLRLTRMLGAVEQHLQAQQAQREADDAHTAQMHAMARLLVRPPVSDDRPDEEVFPPELLALSDRWQTQGRAYVHAVRQFLLHRQAAQQGHADSHAPTPAVPDEDPRTAYAAAALQIARVIHRTRDRGLAQRLRQRFAFAPDAVRAQAQEHGQCVSAAYWIDDERILVRVGAPWQDTTRWILLAGMQATPLPTLQGVGRSANRQCWAVCDEGQLTTRSSLQGNILARFALPTGYEGLHGADNRPPVALAQRCDHLIPFNDGQRVLLCNPTGIYLLHPHHVQRLHPQPSDDASHDDVPELSMEHMALSDDEQWIALGDQDSDHIVLNASDGTLRWRLSPESEYPHHTAFLGHQLLANACHLYHGNTGVWDLRALQTMAPADAQPIHTLPHWRVYASTHWTGPPGMEAVLGDAHGYLHAINASAQSTWSHHIGGTLSALDASDDGTILVAGSYSGYLVMLRTTPPAHTASAESSPPMDPWSIGTSPYHETFRWIFWDDETAPLRW